MTKDWIVYKIDNKIDAVEADGLTQQINDLKDAGAEIIYYLAAKTKKNAINYAEVMLQ